MIAPPGNVAIDGDERDVRRPTVVARASRRASSAIETNLYSRVAVVARPLTERSRRRRSDASRSFARGSSRAPPSRDSNLNSRARRVTTGDVAALSRAFASARIASHPAATRRHRTQRGGV